MNLMKLEICQYFSKDKKGVTIRWSTFATMNFKKKYKKEKFYHTFCNKTHYKMALFSKIKKLLTHYVGFSM